MRDLEDLLLSSITVLEAAFKRFPQAILRPLYSGGYDSFCATYVCSIHPKFTGEVFHIDTGIGSNWTRQYVERVCKEHNWKLRVAKSYTETYEKFVRERGFPGPGRHHWVYVRIKDRAVRTIARPPAKHLLVTGCRIQESVRRMGSVKPIKVGETGKNGAVANRHRIWAPPCHDWSSDEQKLFIDAIGVERNMVKDRLGVSGECLCGAFASPGELNRIKVVCPDVAAEIERLSDVARSHGKHDRWGERPPQDPKGLIVVGPTGPLCSNCDLKARSAGITVKQFT